MWWLMYLELPSHVPVIPRERESIGSNRQFQAIIPICYGSQESAQALGASIYTILCMSSSPYISLFCMSYSPHVSLRCSTLNFRILKLIFLRIPVKSMLCDKQLWCFLSTLLLKAGCVFFFSDMSCTFKLFFGQKRECSELYTFH